MVELQVEKEEAEGAGPAASLTDVLDRLDRVAADDPGAAAAAAVSVEEVQAAVGARSYGPLLLVPGLIVLSPLSGIPGLPSIMAVVILLISGEMLLGGRQFWLPRTLRRRRVETRRLRQAVRFLRPVARVTDRLVRPRLGIAARGAAAFVIAPACILLALTMPVLELIPLANTAAGAIVSIFGLALVAQDGVLALIGLGLTGALVYGALTTLVL